MAQISIRPLALEDAPAVSQFFAEHWGAPVVVSRGRVHQGAALPGFLALQDSAWLGLLTFHVEGESCEIVSLDSLAEGQGIGSALIGAVVGQARREGWRRLWLITTNDNTHALRFYQRRGFVLAALHRDAVALSRRLKPSIPLLGNDGIPIRDEIELEFPL